MKKFKLRLIDIICFICIVLSVIGILAIPTIGSLVLVEEILTSILMLTAGGWILYFVCELFKSGENKKDIIWILLMMFLLLGAGVLNTKNVVLDLSQGSRTIILEECSVEKGTGVRGILSLHYYIEGTDQYGQEQRFEISGHAYKELGSVTGVSLKCYEHTGRVASY